MGNISFLEKVVRNHPTTGEKMSVDDSIDRIIGEMDFALAELDDGEWNGMTIKDNQRIPSHLEEAIKPILDAGAAVMNTISHNTRAPLSVTFEDRARLGGAHSVHLEKLENKLQGAVDRWLNYVDQSEFSAVVGKPLAVNDAARNGRGEGTYSLSSALRMTKDDGAWKPHSLVNDIDAQQKVRLLVQSKMTSEI